MTLPKSTPRNTWYLALEFDQFPAQVIAAWRPELAGKPFVVTRQQADSHKSIVWAASPAAQRLNIETGIPIHVLQKRFPGVTLAPQDAELEQTALKEIARIIETFSPDFLLKDYGRAMIDLTHSPLLRKTAPARIAETLRSQIKFNVSLTEVAAAVSQSGLVARLLSREAKPDGLRVCAPGCEAAEIAPLSVSRLPGLSALARQKLLDYALNTIGQVQALSRVFLNERFDAEGDYLYGVAHAIDDQKGKPKKQEPVNAETMLTRDINDVPDILNAVRYTADKLCHALRSQGMKTNSLTCCVKYSDNKKVQKSRNWTGETNDFNTLTGIAQTLFTALYQRRVAVKSILLMTTRPKQESGQLALFESAAEKKQKAIANGISRVRERMGFKTLLSASNLTVAT